ncbi:hypothetical protein [Marinobacter sp. NFXS9]|uniref:hypothetical protein n=1 Tax=Marinobacter sp. NFXS9 TaxID=2818433 RepID=UPI0032DECD26
MYSRIDLPLQCSLPLATLLALCWAIPTGLALTLTTGLAAGHLMASVVFVWLGWRSVRRFALLGSQRAVTGLHLRRQQLSVRTAEGSDIPVTVAANSRLTSRVALLKLRPEASTLQEHTVLLVNLPFCTNVDPDAFRRLRVWLRFAGSPSPSSNQPV